MTLTRSVEDGIKNWLETQGYPLEMRVARAFLARTFTVSQGSSYTDPTTKAIRELDVRGLVGSSFELANKRTILIVLELATECKSTRGKPWIAFSDSDNFFSAFPPVWDFQMSKAAVWLSTALDNAGIEAARFPFPEAARKFPRAYSATIGFREPNSHDLAYQSLMVATAAAFSSNHPDDENHKASMDAGHLFCHASIPLVVVDNGLFLASLTPEGQLHVHEVPGAVVQVVGGSGPKRAIVIQERALPEFLDSLNQAIDDSKDAFAALSKPVQEKVWSETYEMVTKGSVEDL